jgi:hypothetical protein
MCIQALDVMPWLSRGRCHLATYVSHHAPERFIFFYLDTVFFGFGNCTTSFRPLNFESCILHFQPAGTGAGFGFGGGGFGGAATGGGFGATGGGNDSDVVICARM